MKAARFVPAIAIAVILSSLLLVPGCSVIGLVIGAINDSGTPDSVSVSSWQIDSLSPGEEVFVLLNDGRQYRDATLRLTSTPLTAYGKEFDDFVARKGTVFLYPKPMDTVAVTSITGSSFSATVVAYDHKGIWLRRDSIPPLNLRYSSVRYLEFKGTTWTGNEIFRAVETSEIPLRTAIVIADKSSGKEFCTVSPVEISVIRYEASSRGALTGFLIGAAIDAVVLVVAASSEKPTPAPRTGNSCPFVYSYDGREYVLDSETFTGAIFKALERTDSDILEHLADMNGTARLRIANQLPEIQYVNQLRILAVDHPAGTEIVARSESDFRLISHPQPPFSVRDFAGHVVTPLISRKDSIAWISNPAGRDPGNPASVRDGLELQFRRPSGAGQAKLVFTLQNTPWAVEMEEQLLRLQGTDLHRWYEAMNASSDLREGFMEAVKREAMLSVQLWEGRSWKNVGTVPLVGPYVEKSHVLDVDLRGTPENDLRIRLESTAGLWTINSVQADFTPDAPVEVSEALLTRATDTRGSDLRRQLERIDGSYYILKNGDEAELIYSLPAKKEGRARSYVLLSTGYYMIDVPAVGTPRHDLVRWIGSEEGAFGRYSTGLFNAWLNNVLAARRQAEEAAALGK